MQTKLDKVVTNFLLDFGLNQKEIVCYIALLKTGPTTIMNLARETGIKRSTTHNIVEDLVSKGLVTQTNYGARRLVVAEKPEKLKIILEQRKWDMSRFEDNLVNIINAINNAVGPTTRENVEVSYYIGIKGVREVIQRIINKAEEEILIISNSIQWGEVFGEFDKKFFTPERLKKGISLRLLQVKQNTTDTEVEQNEELKKEVRILPEGAEFDTTTIIYKDEVCILVSLEPYVTILIENKHVYKTQKALFEVLWKACQNS